MKNEKQLSPRGTENKIAEGLDALQFFQQFVSEHHGPIDPAEIGLYTFAMIVELSEWVQETNWKPWKNSENNTKRIVEEWADVLAFIGVLLTMMKKMGIEPEYLAHEYMRKSQINVQRFTGKIKEYRINEKENNLSG